MVDFRIFCELFRKILIVFGRYDKIQPSPLERLIPLYTITDLYDLEHTLAKGFLAGFTYPWEALSGIKAMILELGSKLGEDYAEIAPQVWVHKTARWRLRHF